MKTKVGVLYGGISLEYEVSLASAKTIKDSLDTEKYEIVDLFIDKSGQWFVSNKDEGKKEISDYHDLNEYVDVVVSVLHGSFGEDGKVQRILEKADVKFIGSNSLSSFLSFSKIISKKIFQKNDIPTPKFISFCNRDLIDFTISANKIEKKLGDKVVIKTSESGSSFGVYICKNSDDITISLKKAFEIGDEVLAEEHIQGKEYTCGVMENNDGKIISLPIVEIIPKREFFDFKAKYENHVEEVCPAIIKDKNLESEISKLAISVHRALGLNGYSRTDFIYHPERGLFVLEVNTLPGMTETSLYPQELNAEGISISNFLDRMINSGVNN